MNQSCQNWPLDTIGIIVLWKLSQIHEKSHAYQHFTHPLNLQAPCHQPRPSVYHSAARYSQTPANSWNMWKKLRKCRIPSWSKEHVKHVESNTKQCRNFSLEFDVQLYFCTKLIAGMLEMAPQIRNAWILLSCAGGPATAVVKGTEGIQFHANYYAIGGVGVRSSFPFPSPRDHTHLFRSTPDT